MAVQILMPKQGNSVESCIIVEWKKKEGDSIAEGDVICQAETDKSTIDVESNAEGTILKLLYNEGDDVPVMLPIAIVGQAGENIDDLLASAPSAKPAQEEPKEETKAEPEKVQQPKAEEPKATASSYSGLASPRARNLAEKNGFDISLASASGPKGRIIERDVLKALSEREPLTPLAKQAAASGLTAPAVGTGIGGRVRACDMLSKSTQRELGLAPEPTQLPFPGETEETQLKSIRKVIAKRMHDSLATTAQLTLNAFADARALKSLRAKFKAADESYGVSKISINDLVMFAVSRTLVNFTNMNAHLLGDKIVSFKSVHLGMATDTEKGLMVPVIKNADKLSLKGISAEAKRLASLCHDGKAQPDDLTGSTFTVTNVGAFGVESFTPVLNIPEVAILGVGAIFLKPVEVNGKVEFHDSIGLSLTIDHQVVDGAPGARFLKALCENIANIDLLLAVEG